MSNLSQIAFDLGSWANALPALWRKRVYKTVKIVATVATLALLILPSLPGVGITLPNQDNLPLILSAVIAFLGHLAERNTVVESPLDMTPAPEPTTSVSDTPAA